MRQTAVILLTCAYVLVAFTAGALFWRAGAGWPVAFAVVIAASALMLTVHNLVGRTVDASGLKRELSSLRDAHRILTDHVEETQNALEALSETFQAETQQRTEAIVNEVRMLEDLVNHMGQSLEAQLARAPAAATEHPRIDRQRTALLVAIREALAENRVDLYLQPVVNLPQRRTVYYESFSRLRDATGRVMMPAEYLSVAEPEGLMSAIDNLLLFRCVQIVRRLAKQDRKVGIFCNISPASLGDQTFFPQFLEFLAQNSDLSNALIFELGQTAFRERGAVESRNMAKLADLGFRFSLDKVSDLDFDYADLSRSDVKFVKISAEVLLDQLIQADGKPAPKSMKDLQASDFAELTRRNGVEVIAEKIETEREVIDVLDLDVRFGQGHLFGEPRAIREAVLAETAPPQEFIQTALRRSA